MLKSGADWLDVSMVSRSFRPSVRRTHRSRFGSEGDSWVSEQNSAMRFLQTLLLTFLEGRRRWVESRGGSMSLVIRVLFSATRLATPSFCGGRGDRIKL